MRYEDSDVCIDPPEGGRAPVHAKFKSSAEAEGKLTVADLDQLKQNAAKLNAGFDEAAVKQFGVSLFEALLPDAVGALYQNAFKTDSKQSRHRSPFETANRVLGRC